MPERVKSAGGDTVYAHADLGWPPGVAAVIVLISVVGGRIVPSFTRNWLIKRQGTHLPAVHGWVDRAALAVLPLTLLGWAFLPALSSVGSLLVAGAALHLWRLLRWRGYQTSSEPLLLILHIGYGWARARDCVARLGDGGR